jgi:hypothetical protein
MGDDLLNGLSILAYLMVGTALIVFLGHGVLKKIGPPK